MINNNTPLLRPTYAEINLSAFKANLLKVKGELAQRGAVEAKVMLLVKANAYGHGMLEISAYAQKHGLCAAFGVASIEEGIVLRAAGITLPILVLGSIFPFDYFEHALKNNLAVTVASVRAANYVKELAAKLKITAHCHIKQETGMGRIGSRKPAALEILKTLNSAPYIEVEGVYTHFSSADSDGAYTEAQLDYFKQFLAEASALNLKTGIAHIAASSGFLNYPAYGFDMVRLGHLAYGLDKGYAPVLSLKSKVVFIKDVRSDVSISYRRTFTTSKPSKIATIPIGYGDGYHRLLSNKASVLISGKRCPVAGNITMDMLMADITELGDIAVGSDVVLIGAQGKESIPASELAAHAQTIDYEVVTSITCRVPRVPKED